MNKILMVIFILVVLCWGYSAWQSTQKPTLEECIKKLNSDNFDTVRRAQSDICKYGQNALPSLRQSAFTSSNPSEAELCCYLIGDIDPKTYGTLLAEAAQLGRVKIALYYPNTTAMRSLPAKDRQDLIADINKAHLAASEDLNKLELFISQAEN